jgi:hypothetical protein
VSEARVTLLGLPLTGKSTFIGALWHFVEEPSIDYIREAALPGDRKHIQALADHVRELSEIDRTGHDADERFEVPVEFPGAGTVTLVIPDHSGEQLQGLVERRIWPELLREELASASAVILFVNPDTTRPPLELHLLDGTAPENGEQPEYDNHRACTAAQLIDGLESVIEATRERWPIRIAVVISAFDKAGEVTPGDWLDKRLPALAAMLASDPGRVQSATFGVCAQGGRREDAESVLKKGDLHERAWAQSANGTAVPFSEPVRWALGWE